MLTPPTLKKLQDEQKKLDEFIRQKNNITDSQTQESFVRGKIALLVEIGELANELKTFKHWKKQKEVNWAKAKEELIDCLHFYLSFTNDFHIDFFDYNKFKKFFQERFSERKDNVMPHDLSSQSITRFNELLLDLFFETERMMPVFYIPEKEHFYRWLIIFEELAQKMGMKNEEDIYQAYMAKNDINWKRQRANY